MGFMSENIAIYRTTLKNTLAYRFSMLFSLLSGPLYAIVSYTIWQAIFSATERAQIAGFTFEQMTTYVVINAVTGYLIWDNVNEHLANSIKKGNFSVFMLKPLSFIRYQFICKVAHRTMAAFIEFLPVAIILGLFVGFDVYKTQNLFFYLGAVAIAFVTRYLINLILGIFAFWVVETHGVFFIYRSTSIILNGNLLPLSFFPLVVQKIFFLLPFQFIAYVPARMFMGNYVLGGIQFTPIEVLAYGVFQIFVLSIITILFWKFSTKRFCGEGI